MSSNPWPLTPSTLTRLLSYPLTLSLSYPLTLAPTASLREQSPLFAAQSRGSPPHPLPHTSYCLTLLLSYFLTPPKQYSPLFPCYNGVLKQSYGAIFYTLTIDKAGVWGNDKSRIRYASGVGPEHSTGRRKPENAAKRKGGIGYSPVQSVRKDHQPDSGLQRFHSTGDRKLILSPAVIQTKRPRHTAGPFCIYLLIIIRHKNIKKNCNDEKIVKKCPYICLHIKAETNIFIILNA